VRANSTPALLFSTVDKMSESKDSSGSRYALEPMASWRNWVFVLSRRKIATAPTLLSRRVGSDFESLAQVSEDIRERCASIIDRTDELIALRQDFVDVFGEVGKLLDETEGNSSALLERTELLANEEKEHGRLKTLFRTLREESDKHVHENTLLRGEIDRFNTLVATREARIHSLEQELADGADESQALRGSLERERSTNALTSEKLRDALNDLRGAEEEISRQQAQIAVLDDRSSVAEFHAISLEKSLHDSQAVAKDLHASLLEHQQRAEALTRKLEESKEASIALEVRAKASESALAAAELAYEVAQTVWRQQDQTARDEIDRSNELANARLARAEASEAQLAIARSELQSTTSNLRAKEREAEQLLLKVDPLEERLESSTKEIAMLTEKIAEGEKSRSALADRAHAMVRAMSDLKAKLELAEERAQQLEARLSSEAVRSAANCEQLELRIRVLTESLEKEKAARLMASSSLKAARTRVVRRQTTSLHDVLLRAEEADSDALQAGTSPVAVASPIFGNRAGQKKETLDGKGAAKSALPKSQPLIVRRPSLRRGESS